MMEVTINIPLVDKVSAHVKRHKTKYLVGAGFVVIGGVCYYFGMRTGSSRIASPSASIFGFNNKLDQRVITLVDRQGPPSWITYCIETGEEWSSQRAAAFAERLSPSDLANHLNYGVDLVNGKHYGRRGLAA